MPDGLLSQLGGVPAPEADSGRELEIEEGPDEEELDVLMSDFDDVALPVSERLAALKAALGI